MGQAERGGEERRLVPGLVPREIGPDQRALVPQQPADLVHGRVRALVADDDPDEADLDREPGAGDGVADRVDDVVGVQPGHAGDELGREAQLERRQAVAEGVVDRLHRDPAPVVERPHQGGRVLDLRQVGQQPFLALGGDERRAPLRGEQAGADPLRQLDAGLRTDASFKVTMQVYQGDHEHSLRGRAREVPEGTRAWHAARGAVRRVSLEGPSGSCGRRTR